MVIDTDGSAFITKAEFDSLKNNFQAQIDSYNSSIDGKIDGAIAGYLSGLKVNSTAQLDFFYNNIRFGDGFVRSVKWTSNSNYAFNVASANTYDLQNMSWVQIASGMRPNFTINFVARKDNGTQERFVADTAKLNDGETVISAWGQYGYLCNIDSHFSSYYEASNLFSNYISTDIATPLEPIGRKGEVWTYMGTGATRTEDPPESGNFRVTGMQYWYQKTSGVEELPNTEGSLTNIRFAPNSSAFEAVVGNQQTTTATKGVDYVYNQERSGYSYILANCDSIDVDTIFARTADFRTLPSNYNGVRMNINLQCRWFNVIQHNMIKYDTLISIQPDVTDYPIACGIALAGPFQHDGIIKIKAKSDVSDGKLIVYNGQHLDPDWGGNKASYTTDSTWVLTKDVEWNFQKQVNKDEYAFVVWLPDIDSVLPITEMIIEYES